MASRAYTKRHWQQVMNDFNASDQSIKSFCAERKLQIGTFRYWQRKFSALPTDGFREVDVASSFSAHRFSGIRLKLSSLSVELDSDFDEVSLARLLKLISC